MIEMKVYFEHVQLSSFSIVFWLFVLPLLPLLLPIDVKGNLPLPIFEQRIPFPKKVKGLHIHDRDRSIPKERMGHFGLHLPPLPLLLPLRHYV